MGDEPLIDLDGPVPERERPRFGRSRVLGILAVAAVAVAWFGLWVAPRAVSRRPAVPPFVPSKVRPAQMLAFGGEYGYDSVGGYAYVALADVGSKPVAVSGLAGTSVTPGLRVTSVGVGPASAALGPGGVGALPRAWPLVPTERMRLYIAFVRTCAPAASIVMVTGTATGYGVTEAFSQRVNLGVAIPPSSLPPCG